MSYSRVISSCYFDKNPGMNLSRICGRDRSGNPLRLSKDWERIARREAAAPKIRVEFSVVQLKMVKKNPIRVNRVDGIT